MARGDVYYANLPKPTSSSGHVQAGSRPCIIVSTDDNKPQNPIVSVIPLTTKQAAVKYPHTLQINPSRINGLTNISIALVFQLTGIDKSILMDKIGQLEPDDLKKIDDILRVLLGL